jgi:hypothetical protein
VAYSTDITTLLTGQLAKFTTLNRHQLVGHVANLEFWVAEVRHCLDVIDGYAARFKRLKSAVVRHLSEHSTTEFDLDEPVEINWPAEPPHRVPGSDLKEARRDLCESAYRFLVRCFNEGLIEEATLRKACDGLGVGVEARDLKTRA